MKGTWKVRAAELRRIAAQTREPERERKMLALAEQLEEQEPGVARREDAPSGTPRGPEE